MTIETLSTLVSHDPATGEAVGSVPLTDPGEIPGIVVRARAAQVAWGALPPEERAARLAPAGERLVAEAERIGLLATREMGKPLREAVGETRNIGKGLAEEAREIARDLGDDVLEDDRVSTRVHHDPLGVCAAIAPWNFPVAMPHQLVLPALVAGNAVVFKPSEETPLTGQAYAEILQEVLPPDVLQVVHGADAQGKALVAADVDLIAFTGSRETGKKILAAAADGLKRVVLELGGKDPMIVLGDADLDEAATFAARNSFRNAGQVCVSTERIYVHESVAEAFERELARRSEELVLGNGVDEATQIGPMVNERQRAHVLEQVKTALASGARLVAGGTDHPERFIRPTVLADVTHDMAIMRDETFGPVACLQRFSDEEEAVRLANDTPFGLGAVVFGEVEHAHRVARRLQSGMIGVNRSCGGASGSPWVGARQSGYGFQGSREGHRQFAQTRVVSRPK